jgi:hypothetical protein
MITPLYGQMGVLKLGGTKPVWPNISGLQLWLDAADATTLYDATSGGNLVSTDGATVARWQDKSGNGRHFTQATANARPLLKTAIKNSKNIIRCDGANDILSISNVNFTNNISALTMFCVGRTTLAPNNNWQCLINASTGSSAQSSRAAIGINTTTDVGGRRLDANAYQSVSAGTPTINQWALLGGAFNYSSASLVAYKNGTGTSRVGGFQTAGNTSATNSLALSTGGTGASGEWLTGDIAEIIIYNTAITTAQRQSVEAYLNAKWAIY